MSYHFGLGQFSILQPNVNTAKPKVPVKKILPPPDFKMEIKSPPEFTMNPMECSPKTPVPMQPGSGFPPGMYRCVAIKQPPQPPSPTGPITHKAPTAPAALPPNYSEEAMGCHGKMAIPIKSGKPGYPGFLCVDMKPMTIDQKIAEFKEATGGGGMMSIADMQTKPTAGGIPQAGKFPGTQPPGAPFTETDQPTGTVTLEVLRDTCKQFDGKMGTPNCCKFADGSAFGVHGGRLVNVLQCDVGKGPGGNLPLIAGVAALALLLTRR